MKLLGRYRHVLTVLVLLAATWSAIGMAADKQPKTAPAFNAKQLSTLPTQNWITNGGTTFNQRFSPLTRINKENVGQLKANWRTSLNGSGIGPGFSAEAQALVYEGVIYIIAGNDDTYALDVESGEILWSYEAGLDLKKVNVCCGWLSRGVGMGDGKIFVGQLNAMLVALDQKTGDVLWKIQAEDPAFGYSITSAPLYYDGMVITGFAGGEYGIRGRVKAYDADTGRLIWTFYTIPGPGEFGHDTWPQDNDAWKFGGAPVWQTPAIDSELGLIYFSTGNPGPDLNGAIRAGDNLFSVSIVALDIKTGKYRWHFQQVRHDIWDYDSPNPVILFDAMVNGLPRKGLAQASKSGYLYILDRTNGEALIGIVDTPVPQEPSQATAATQPIPVGDRIIPDYIDIVPEGYELVNQGRTFTPFSGDNPVLYKPSAGVNWHPSSYNPNTNIMYICANDGIGGAFGGDADADIGPAQGQQYMGGGFAGARVARRGIFAAMNLTTHRLAWRQQWSSGCNSGSISTAAGLTFVGRGDGRMTALDSDNGKKLWEFQTDGGIHTTATTFEHNGKQYLTFIAGGNLFGGSKSNDGVWLFSLDGKMESLPPDAARGGPPSGPPVFAPPPAVRVGRVADLDNGAEIYRTVCQACHGETGKGGHDNGAPIPNTVTIDSIMQTADTGKNDMPSFRGVYTAEELHDVATYIREKVLSGN